MNSSAGPERLEDAVASLAAAVERLGERIAALEARVDALGPAGASAARADSAASSSASLAAAGASAPPAASPADAGAPLAPGDLPPLVPLPLAAAEAADAGSEVVALLTLVGRTCLVLGGAYLLRALTDAGTLPRAAGTLVGLAYALAWIALAARTRGPHRVAGAAFHGAAAALIAYPLLWEATIRFELLTPAAAAAGVAVVSALGLAVAWRRRVQVLAWIITSGALMTALAFMAALGPVAPMGLLLAALGVGTLWFGYSLDWTWLRWPPAVVADFTVVAMVAAASRVWARLDAGSVMLVQLALFTGYLVSFAARTLWRSRDVVPFEVVQTLALAAVGLGGAAYLMVATGSSVAGLGAGSLVFGAGSYGVAFAFIDWRRGHWKNFVFYASLGAVFILAGTALAVPPPARAVAWAALAVITAAGGRHYRTITLSSHATVYTIAAAYASGLLGHANAALTASAAHAWAPLTAAGLVALGGAAVACAVPLASGHESWGEYSRIPKLLVVAVFLWGLGGAVVGAAVPPLAGLPGGSADAASVAAIRTVVFAVSALALAWSSRGLFPEGRWYMYIVLVAGGLKLLVEDFPNGRPATLFLAFAIYGGALILGPRIAARSTKQGSGIGDQHGRGGAAGLDKM